MILLLFLSLFYKKALIKLSALIGVPGGTRTPGLELRRLAFYPAKLQAQVKLPYYYNGFLKFFQ